MLIATELFEPLIGQYAWQIKKGYGSFLTMEFGEPRLEIREPRSMSQRESEKVRHIFEKRMLTIVGQWHFWIENADWKIATKNFKASNFDTDLSLIDHCLDELSGQILLKVESNDSMFRFYFDLGGSLILSCSTEFMDEDQWTLYCPNKKTYSCLGDGSISEE